VGVTTEGMAAPCLRDGNFSRRFIDGNFAAQGFLCVNSGRNTNYCGEGYVSVSLAGFLVMRINPISKRVPTLRFQSAIFLIRFPKENYLCRLFLTGCITGSCKLRFLKSSPILLAYIALLA
jgi:hypothetical protein